ETLETDLQGRRLTFAARVSSDPAHQNPSIAEKNGGQPDESQQRPESASRQQQALRQEQENGNDVGVLFGKRREKEKCQRGDVSAAASFVSETHIEDESPKGKTGAQKIEARYHPGHTFGVTGQDGKNERGCCRDFASEAEFFA